MYLSIFSFLFAVSALVFSLWVSEESRLINEFTIHLNVVQRDLEECKSELNSVEYLQFKKEKK